LVSCWKSLGAGGRLVRSGIYGERRAGAGAVSPRDQRRRRLAEPVCRQVRQQPDPGEGLGQSRRAGGMGQSFRPGILTFWSDPGVPPPEMRAT